MIAAEHFGFVVGIDTHAKLTRWPSSTPQLVEK
jgi:hypothetical protein